MNLPPPPEEHGRVLLVDDEPAFQRLGGAFLRNLGHEVLSVGDGDEALSAFARERPDLVLLDLAMPPSMDAEQGLALIPRLSGVPVVVLTGHAEHALALRAAERGAWDFLPKPIDPDLLRFVVTRALRKRRLDAELIRLRVDPSQGHYPTMSGHKSRFAVRFLPLGELETGDIEFQLACC